MAVKREKQRTQERREAKEARRLAAWEAATQFEAQRTDAVPRWLGQATIERLPTRSTASDNVRTTRRPATAGVEPILTRTKLTGDVPRAGFNAAGVPRAGPPATAKVKPRHADAPQPGFAQRPLNSHQTHRNRLDPAAGPADGTRPNKREHRRSHRPREGAPSPSPPSSMLVTPTSSPVKSPSRLRRHSRAPSSKDLSHSRGDRLSRSRDPARTSRADEQHRHYYLKDKIVAQELAELLKDSDTAFPSDGMHGLRTGMHEEHIDLSFGSARSEAEDPEVIELRDERAASDVIEEYNDGSTSGSAPGSVIHPSREQGAVSEAESECERLHVPFRDFGDLDMDVDTALPGFSTLRVDAPESLNAELSTEGTITDSVAVESVIGKGTDDGERDTAVTARVWSGHRPGRVVSLA